MLIELNVKNIALIDHVRAEFGEGLNILTGETGAGKSVIIDSVMLALGSRTRSELIRTGEEQAYVELVFSVSKDKADRLRALGAEPDEDGLIIVSRRISPGRSISRVGDETVTLSRLREITGELIDIYGQNEYHTLLDNSRHLMVLDSFLGEGVHALKREVSAAYQSYREAERKKAEFGEDEAARAREEEILSHELSEIDAARLKDGEEEELSREYKRLNNLSRIMEHLNRAYEELNRFDPGRVAQETLSAAGYDEQLKNVYDEALDMESTLNLLMSDISSYAEDMDTDEERLSEVEKRLDLIRSLETKYGRTIEDIYIYRERIAKRLEELKNFEESRDRAERDCLDALKRLKDLSLKLSDMRKEGAGRLSSKVSEELKELAFSEACVALDFREAAFSEQGMDEVTFMASLNPGEPMKPLSGIASGGELSRVCLALKTVLARTDDIPTLIFDEIDAGISGRTAQRIAERMSVLAREHQVIAVSHLPQIAAMADRHFVIDKQTSSGRNITGIRKLDREGEVQELARLLGGSRITDAVRSNAQEMKRLAEEYKGGAL